MALQTDILNPIVVGESERGKKKTKVKIKPIPKKEKKQMGKQKNLRKYS